MSTFPWLTVIGAVPLAGALVIAVTPGVSAPGSGDCRANSARNSRPAFSGWDTIPQV